MGVSAPPRPIRILTLLAASLLLAGCSESSDPWPPAENSSSGLASNHAVIVEPARPAPVKVERSKPPAAKPDTAIETITSPSNSTAGDRLNEDAAAAGMTSRTQADAAPPDGNSQEMPSNTSGTTGLYAAAMG